MHAPLFTRPVVMEMLSKWLPRVAKSSGLDHKLFEQYLDAITAYELRRVVGDGPTPPALHGSRDTQMPQFPVLVLLANYTVNLVLVRASVSELQLSDSLSGRSEATTPWDCLTNLWRSALPIERLAELSAVLTSSKRNGIVNVNLRPEFAVDSNVGKLQRVFRISSSLSDLPMAALAGLALCAQDSVDVSIQHVGELVRESGLEAHAAVHAQYLRGVNGTYLDEMQFRQLVHPELVTWPILAELVRIQGERGETRYSRTFFSYIRDETLQEDLRYIELAKGCDSGAYSCYLLERYFAGKKGISLELIADALRVMRDIGSRRVRRKVFDDVLNQYPIQAWPPALSAEMLAASRDFMLTEALGRIFRHLTEFEVQEHPFLVNELRRAACMLGEVDWLRGQSDRQHPPQGVVDEFPRELIIQISEILLTGPPQTGPDKFLLDGFGPRSELVP